MSKTPISTLDPPLLVMALQYEDPAVAVPCATAYNIHTPSKTRRRGKLEKSHDESYLTYLLFLDLSLPHSGHKRRGVRIGRSCLVHGPQS